MDVAAPEAVENRSVPLTFTAKGSEYFAIWIVNVVLTILTLGIYSAWAEVRRRRYFYRHTSLAGASFAYHGDPRAILKGRLLAGILLLACSGAWVLDPLAGLAVALAAACVLPWLLWCSLRFHAHHSTWRGRCFAFRGTLLGAYLAYLMLPLAALASLFLLAASAHQLINAYCRGNTWYGDARFRFSGSQPAFYRLWLKAAALMTAAGVVLGALAALAVSGFAYVLSMGPGGTPYLALIPATLAVAAVVLAALIIPYLSAQIQNLLWSHTAVGSQRFASRIEAGTLRRIWLSNLLATIATLGLFRPFAVVRLMRYRLGAVSLEGADSRVGPVVGGPGSVAGCTGDAPHRAGAPEIAL